MASTTRTLAVKYTTEGFKEAIAALNQVGVAFDQSLADARKAVEEAIAASKKAQQAGNVQGVADAEAAAARAAKQANQAIQNSYRELGIRSSQSIEQLKDQAISAFNALKASGVASASDIARAQKALDRRLEELNAQLGETAGGFDALTAKITQTGGAWGAFVANIAANQVNNLIDGALGKIREFFGGLATNIFQAGTQTEGLKAQLKTLEGSAEAAEKAYKQIAKFAQTTPYELAEVTQAYISLYNRGMKPTEKQLRQIGDLAASQNKPLQQYVEAILDAMSGENERLKEFGINASKAGDKVSFTFKGVTKTVEASDKAIADALLSFSDMAGVMGGMEERAKTTEGKLSNLNDALAGIYVNLFNSIKPALDAVIEATTEAITPLQKQEGLYKTLTKQAENFRDYLKNNPAIVKEISKQLEQGVVVALDAAADTAKSVLEFLQKNPTAIQDTIAALKLLIDTLGLFIEGLNVVLQGWKNIADTIRVINQEIPTNKGINAQESDVRAAILAAGGTEDDVIRVLKGIEEEVKQLGLVGQFLPDQRAAIVNRRLQQELQVLAAERRAGLKIINPYPQGSPLKAKTDVNIRPDGEHKGLDIMGKVGDTVVSPVSGTLVYAQQGRTKNKEDSNPDKAGYQAQHSVLIKLDAPIYVEGKKVEYVYLTHFTELDQAIANRGTDFNKPVRITAGQRLGAMGTAGGGPHVHLTMAEDRYQRGTLNEGQTYRVFYPGQSAPEPMQSVRQATGGLPDYRTGYERLAELEARLKQNPLFANNPAALAAALIIAAGESGSSWLRAGSKTNLFSAMGGAGNKMRGFAQFNTAYFNSQTANPDSYIQFLAEILTGQRVLPKGRGRFNPQKLQDAIKSGQIKTEADLLAFLQKEIPIIDWHGLHESGGGGGRIRSSGVLARSLAMLQGGGQTSTQLAKQEQLIAEQNKRLSERERQRQEQERRALADKQEKELLAFDAQTAKLPEAERAARARLREEMVAANQVARERLEIEQAIKNLEEERIEKEKAKKAGEPYTGRDISAEIRYLQERKRALEENAKTRREIDRTEEARRLAQEARARASERRQQEQKAEITRLEEEQRKKLLAFDAQTAKLPESERAARAKLRADMVRENEIAKRRLEIEQSLTNLKEERRLKQAGELSTGRDITAEIKLLEEQKQNLIENAKLEQEIAEEEEARRLAQEARARATERRKQQQQEELDRLALAQQQELLQFDAATAAEQDPAIRRARQQQREELERRHRLLRESLEFEQAIANLEEERRLKASGELTTGRDITAEIELLKERKRVLEETLRIEREIGQTELEAAIREETEAITDSFIEIDRMLTQIREGLAPTSPDLRQKQLLDQINDQFNEYKQGIIASMRAISDLIKFKQALGLATEEEIAILERLKAKYLEMQDLQNEATRQGMRELGFRERQIALDQAGVVADLDSQIAEAMAGQLRRRGDEFGANDVLRENAYRQEELRYQQQLLDLEVEFKDQPAKLEELKQKALELNQIRLDGIRSEFKTLGDTVADVAANAFGQFFEDLFTGTKSVGEAFRDMAVGILRSLAQIAAQMLAMRLIGGLFGGLFGGGGGAIASSASSAITVGSGLGQLAPGFASGGLVEGPGSDRSDSILARLSRGEFVVNADAVRFWGRGFLSSVNRKSLPLSLADFSTPPTGGKVYNVAQNFNITTPDANSFKASEGQIGRATGEYLRRSLLRNG